jgi:hypothetical protein
MIENASAILVIQCISFLLDMARRRLVDYTELPGWSRARRLGAKAIITRH